MSEKITSVQMVKVEYVCDNCEKGHMVRDHNHLSVLLSDPPKYPHVCKHCSHEDVFTKQYPLTGYRELKS